jgi:hypothetical protein
MSCSSYILVRTCLDFVYWYVLVHTGTYQYILVHTSLTDPVQVYRIPDVRSHIFPSLEVQLEVVRFQVPIPYTLHIQISSFKFSFTLR